MNTATQAAPAIKWHEWNPGLHNGERELQQELATLPAAKADAIPWIVRLFENPASHISFPGAINLSRHDAIHVLLGRGLRNQDEAFVIGFTMGCSSAIQPWQAKIFRWLISHIYPQPYRFRATDLIAYDLGFNFGREIGARDLDRFPFEKYRLSRLRDLRQWLGINTERMQAIYRLEALLIANTHSSHRLDLH